MHVLACEMHSWCSNGHASGWVLVPMLTGGLAIGVCAVVARVKRGGR
jgi:hypothetical protein